MCGIAGAINLAASVDAMLDAISHRGPDGRGIAEVNGGKFGHVRLSIMDPTDASAQPFTKGHTTLIYNGELWNYLEIKTELEQLGVAFSTTGDTEVFAAALDIWGISALVRLHGMFAAAWSDGRGTWLARDRFGEIPVHAVTDGKGWAFCSEIKGLRAASIKGGELLNPGTVIDLITGKVSKYYDTPVAPRKISIIDAAASLRRLMEAGARERSMSDVPVCMLLSGGIDSSAIAYHLSREMPNLVAYTAVLDRKSKDLRCARSVAEALKINLVEVPVPVPSADDLSGVVRTIEMSYKTQVEIGWPCLKLAEAMRLDGFKVTFSGEGSDELWASYGFSYYALKVQNWHAYRKELFLTQARKNFPRCNKAFMAESIECRLPFLHVPIVEFALSLPKDAVRKGANLKAIMSMAYADVLPPEIIKRQKVAFQDGMGLKVKISEVVSDPRRFYERERFAYFN